MSPDSLQIVNAFENVGLTPQEIAEELSYDIGAVKMTLLAYSSVYRKQSKNGNDDSVEFTQEDQNAAKRVIVELMEDADSDAVRYRASRYVLDVASGRLQSEAPQVQINIGVINERMLNAREAIKAAKAKVIDIPEHIKTLV